MNLYHSSERAAKPNHVVVYLRADGQTEMIRLEVHVKWTEAKIIQCWTVGALT